MGKKKKKYSTELFETDYTNISFEDQMKMHELTTRIINGEDVDMSFICNSDKKTKKHDESDTDSLGELLDIISNTLSDDEDENNTKTYMDYVDEIEECSVNTEFYTKQSTALNHDTASNTNDDKASGDIKSKIKSGAVLMQAVSRVQDDEVESDDDNDDMSEYEEETLDNQFKVIEVDEETSDIIIRDSWNPIKSNVISFYNLIEANFNYTNSNLYDQMKSTVEFALAFISGPLLVIKQGNELFKDFINTVEAMDTDRIFICSKLSETDVDTNGDPACHFLVYHIDQFSIDTLSDLFESFESQRNKDKQILLDFLYAVYKKASDRHTNSWSCYESVDMLIDDYESDDDDIEYVLDLIKKEDSTVMGTSNFDNFLDKFVFPIETFITDKYTNSNIFRVIEKLLSHHLDMTRKDIIVEDGVIQVPDNFGYDDYGTNRSNFHNMKSDIEKPERVTNLPDTVMEDVSAEQTVTEEVTSANISIDDIDDDDDFEIEIKQETKTTANSLEFTVEKEPHDTVKSDLQNDSGMKKFGSKPYTGGSMILH